MELSNTNNTIFRHVVQRRGPVLTTPRNLSHHHDVRCSSTDTNECVVVWLDVLGIAWPEGSDDIERVITISDRAADLTGSDPIERLGHRTTRRTACNSHHKRPNQNHDRSHLPPLVDLGPLYQSSPKRIERRPDRVPPSPRNGGALNVSAAGRGLPELQSRRPFQ